MIELKIGDFIVECVLDITCPVCNEKTIKYKSEIMNIPYFDEVLITTIICEKCNYRYSDAVITKQKKPMEHKLKITHRNDLDSRVIRSSTATIEIPELDIKIEPGYASDSFISNIEGILVRIINVIEQAGRFTESRKKREHAKELLAKLDNIRKGNGKLTIIIKDPMGNSVIINEKTEKRELIPEEIKKLKSGMMIIDLQK